MKKKYYTIEIKDTKEIIAYAFIYKNYTKGLDYIRTINIHNKSIDVFYSKNIINTFLKDFEQCKLQCVAINRGTL
jgi:hypothetical protein